HHLALAGAPGPDRRDALDEIPGRELADGGDLLAAEAPLELRLVELAGGEVAEDRVLDVDQLLSLRVEDGERAEREQVLLFHEKGGQRLPAIVGQQVVAVDQARDVLAVAQRRLLEV